MSKLKIAILYGGRSVEHKISINSAKNVFKSLDKDRFIPYCIGITEAGDWYHTDGVTDDIDLANPLQLKLSVEKPGFVNAVTSEEFIPNVLFPVLHGTNGEDGSIQGLLTAMDLPFAGTGVLGSAVSMSKLFSKRLLVAAGIPTSKFLSATYDEKDQLRYDDFRKELGVPFMAKSANLGSSVGVTKVKNETDFDVAVKEGFRFDDTMLFEQYIEGRELECSILGNKDAKVSLPAEIVVSSDYEFYTYEAKYQDPDAVQLKVPAEVDSDTTERIRSLSLEAYQALGCEDFARVDIFLNKNNEIFINEVNTIPGFTNFSMFPMMWQERGISFTDLISEIIDLAIERHERKSKVNKHFESNK